MPSRRQAGVTVGVDMMAACRTEALSKVYGRRDTAVHALRDITLSIPRQTFTAIMGPSGSGKSTLLHCLAALDTPTSGRVFLGHTELTALSRREQAQVRRDRIGFVFQSFNLVPTLDAWENITLPQQLAGRRPERDWINYVVEQIGLGDRLHHRPNQLSGGQQQRVALARALAGRPEVIFADEPTGSLDTKASREMLALLRSAVDDFHQTVVMVTHDPAVAGYADQVLFFTDGQVVDQVLRPDTNLVLEHLQYLDSSTPAHVSPRGQLRASTQWDGQHTMRSRKRRRADESPGRPMVGSDDEVEVARQERWLQRIREQFENDNEDIPGDGAQTGGGFHPAPPHEVRSGYQARAGTDDHLASTQRALPVSDDTHHAAVAARHRANGSDTFGARALPSQTDDDGWLPPVRALLNPDAPGAAEHGHTVPPAAPAQSAWSDQNPASTGNQPLAATSGSTTAHDDVPAPPRGGWDTSDWTQQHTQRWDQQPAAAAGHNGWRDDAADEWHSQPPATVAEPEQPAATWTPEPPGAGADSWASEARQAETGSWTWNERTDGHWTTSGSGWSVGEPSQPPADTWGPPQHSDDADAWRAGREDAHRPADHGGADGGYRNGHAPATSWQPWQPDTAAHDPAQPSGYLNGNGHIANGDHGVNGYAHDGYAADHTNGHGPEHTGNGHNGGRPHDTYRPAPDYTGNGHGSTDYRRDPDHSTYGGYGDNGFDDHGFGFAEHGLGGIDGPGHRNGHEASYRNGFMPSEPTFTNGHAPDHGGHRPQDTGERDRSGSAPVDDVDLNSGEWRIGKPAADGSDTGSRDRGWSSPDDSGQWSARETATQWAPDDSGARWTATDGDTGWGTPAHDTQWSDDDDADDDIGTSTGRFDIWSPTGIEEPVTAAPTADDQPALPPSASPAPEPAQVPEPSFGTAPSWPAGSSGSATSGWPDGPGDDTGTSDWRDVSRDTGTSHWREDAGTGGHGPPATDGWQAPQAGSRGVTRSGSGRAPRSGSPGPTTTDPFEALQSLQAQLNRLGSHNRKTPRRRGG